MVVGAHRENEAQKANTDQGGEPFADGFHNDCARSLASA
jgi:hypothetical protein